MLTNDVVVEDVPAPAITPDLLSKLKREDMKQAIVERFRSTREAAPVPAAARRGQRSPYWRPSDEEC